MKLNLLFMVEMPVICNRHAVQGNLRSYACFCWIFLQMSAVAFSFVYTDDSAVLAAVPHSRDMSDRKRRGEQNGPAWGYTRLFPTQAALALTQTQLLPVRWQWHACLIHQSRYSYASFLFDGATSKVNLS